MITAVICVCIFCVCAFVCAWYSWGIGYDDGFAASREKCIRIGKELDEENARFMYALAEELKVPHSEMISSIKRVRRHSNRRDTR